MSIELSEPQMGQGTVLEAEAMGSVAGRRLFCGS